MNNLIKSKDKRFLVTSAVIILLFLAIVTICVLWLGGVFTYETIVESKSYTEDLIMMNFNQRMSVGEGHYAVITSMGDLYMWGKNDYGQLGDGTNVEKTVPVKVLDKVMSVETVGNMTFALRVDGSLWGWGYDEFDLMVFDKSVPDHIISTPRKIMDYVRYISVGPDYVMVVRTDDTLWGWGNDIYGKISLLQVIPDDMVELGIDTNVPKSEEGYINGSFIPFPEQIMEDILFVSAGTDHTLAITYDYNLLAWGSKSEEKLGINLESFDKPYTSTRDLMIETVRYVSASKGNSAVLDEEGNLFICGNNDFGQYGTATIGLNSVEDKTNIGQGTKLLEKVTYVKMADDRAVALQRNGNLYIWGRDIGNFFSSPEDQELITEPKLYAERIKAVCTNAHQNKYIIKKNDNTLWYFGEGIGKEPVEIILPIEE